MADNNTEFSVLAEELKTGVKGLQENFQKALAEERKTFEELLAKKANDEAISEVKAKLEKIEEKASEYEKQMDEEIAKLRMAATDVKATDQEQEIKDDFFHVVRTGSTAGLPEGRKDALAEVICKQYNLSNENNQQKSLEQIKSMLSGNAVTGGILVVPPYLEASVWKHARENVAFYDMASKITIGGPVYKRDARISRAGAAWEGESDEWVKTATPSYGQIDIPVHKLIATPSISRDLMEDSRVNMEAEIMDFTREAFSDHINLAMVLGDGVRKPRGLLSYPKVKDTKVTDNWGSLGYVVSGKAATFVDAPNQADCLIEMQGILKSAYVPRATWVMNRATGTTIRKFKDSDGNYLWQPSLVAGQPPTLLGAPVRYDENMPSIEANSSPIAYGDFTAALLVVNRRGMTVIQDNITRAGHVKFQIDLRMGAGVTNFEAVKLLKIAAS